MYKRQGHGRPLIADLRNDAAQEKVDLRELGKPFDGATLDRIQQSVTAATNREIVIPDSLRTIYETTGGTPFLDGQYTVFGRVTEGLEIVEAIQGVATDSAGRPLEDVRIIRAEAVRK